VNSEDAHYPNDWKCLSSDIDKRPWMWQRCNLRQRLENVPWSTKEFH
jgi:hypothetical protein